MSGAEALSPEKERQILRGAGTVFSQEGYEGASMSRIASEAGVSKGTLYNYFAGKADLFAAFVNEECTRKIAALFDDTHDETDPEAALRRVAERMIRMIVSPTGLTIFRVTVSEAAKFPELARMFYDAGPARATGHLSCWLTRQTEAGRLVVEDPQFAAEQFFALCQTRLGTLCRLQIVKTPSDAEVARVVDSSVAMFLRTYASPNAAASGTGAAPGSEAAAGTPRGGDAGSGAAAASPGFATAVAGVGCGAMPASDAGAARDSAGIGRAVATQGVRVRA